MTEPRKLPLPDEQDYAFLRDTIPPMWWALHRGNLQQGFTKDESFYLVGCYILSQNPNGSFPGKPSPSKEEDPHES